MRGDGPLRLPDRAAAEQREGQPGEPHLRTLEIVDEVAEFALASDPTAW